MSTWTAKRFWKSTTIEKVETGWQVLLDSRPVRTPAKAPLVVPTERYAVLVAREWDAQEGVIDPNMMPATRSANAAIDKVSKQYQEVAAMLAAYGDADLVCYRATEPEALIARQAEAWDPLLDWFDDALGIRLEPVSGIMHVAQDSAALAAIRSRIDSLDSFELAAFHDLVSISGSVVIANAVTLGHFAPEEAWLHARIDEQWQEEQWGTDDEATEAAMKKRDAFLVAAQIFSVCRD